MNKSLYRIVFNQSRGRLMAVAETAGAQGKAASGQTQGGNSSGSASCGDVGHLNIAFRTLSLCIGLAMGVTVIDTAQAQIKADASAPKAQQPVILQTASGITQVNIATPSAAGVSRNTYSQFDVNRQGVILNNSRANVLTQLGGYAPGNPMLAAGSARVILNEINSANPSFINGYVEVAGQRAEVIIANPSGININGGGFINASRATLTTGTPIMNGGSLDGYLVQRGNINITGAGLDATTADYTGILARAVQVNAGIWAKELKVVAGANQINEAQTTATPTAGTGPAPSFAIDVAQLGGMYAGKITLVGTEAGVGVRNAGVIGATAGDVAISSNGWLSSISNSGTIYAAGNTSLAAQGNITNTATGLIGALGNTSLAANGPGAQVITLAGSVLAAGLKADGSLATTGDLSITSTAAAQLKGQFAAGGGIALTAASLDLSDITLAAQNATLKATTGDVDLSRSTINVAGSTAGTFTANAAQTLRTDGAAVTAGQLNITAQSLSNVAGQIIQTGTGNTSISLAGDLNNTRGRIASNALNLTLAANTLTNADGKLEHAGTGQLTITANTVNGQRGQITSNGALALNGGTLNLDNASTAASQISMNAASISNRQGNITQTGTGNTSITTTGALDNTGGNITSNGNTSITAQTLANQGGSVQATGNSNLSITTQGALDNSAAGSIKAGGDVTLTVDSLNNNAGFVTAVGALTTTATQALNNTAGQIAANGNVSITASSLVNTRGTLASIQGNLQTSTTGQTSNDNGTLQAALDTTVNALGINNTSGKVTGKNVTLTASTGGINNNLGLISATNSATVQDSATVPANKTLAITNTAGSIIAGQLAKVDAASLSGGGKVQSLGDVSIALTSDFNNQSDIVANNNLTFSTTGNLPNSGKLQAGNALTVSAANITNAAAAEITGRSTTITASNSLTNSGLIDGQTTRINAPTLTNTGAGRIYGDDVSIASVNLSNASVIAARNKLDIGTTNLSNSPGATILSVGDMAIGGALDTNRQATGRANVISNHGATIQAMGRLNVSAQTINNTNAGFTYAVYDVAGAGDTVYGTAGGAFYQSQGVNPSAPLAFYRTAGTGVQTYTLNPAAGQGWAGGYLIYNAVQYSTTEQRAVVTSTAPGVISSGSAMALNASSQINNDMSQILAGSSFSITGSASINNIQNTVATTTTQVGSNYTWATLTAAAVVAGDATAGWPMAKVATTTATPAAPPCKATTKAALPERKT